MTLRERIREAINCASAENRSNTPDFILAEFLADCLTAWNKAVNRRENFYSRPVVPGSIGPKPDPVPPEQQEVQ